jgi:cell division protein FtsB
VHDNALDIDGIDLPLQPRRRFPRWLAIALVAATTIGALAALLILPTRSWLTQRKLYAAETRKLEAVEKANEDLRQKIAALQTREEIARIARERYNLVKAGSQVFAVLPDPVPEPLPAVWPYTLIDDLVSMRLQHPESVPTTTVATTAAGADATIVTDATATAESTSTTTPG